MVSDTLRAPGFARLSVPRLHGLGDGSVVRLAKRDRDCGVGDLAEQVVVEAHETLAAAEEVVPTLHGCEALQHGESRALQHVRHETGVELVAANRRHVENRTVVVRQGS